MNVTLDKKLPKKIILLLIGILLVITLIKVVVSFYAPTTKKANLSEIYSAQEGSVAVVVNGKITNVRAKIHNNQVYVRLGLLTDQINSAFYYEANDKKLLYTSSKEIIEAEEGETFEGSKIFFDITQDASKSEEERKEESETLTTNEKIYVLLSYVTQYTNIECKIYENPDRLFIRSKFGTCLNAVTTGSAALRTEPKSSAPIVTTLSHDDVWVVSSTNGWNLVCDLEGKGFSGYLTDEEIDTKKKVQVDNAYNEPKYEYKKLNGKVCLAWHQTLDNSGVQNIRSLLSNAEGINVVSPTWFSVNESNGEIVSRANREYVEIVKNKGLKIWGLVDNFNTDNTLDYSKLLGTRKNRKNLESNLISKAIEYDLDGLNIDFEGLPVSAGSGYLQFIRELAIECRKNNLSITVDCYVPSAWTQHYHRKELSEISDYLIIMAYDEHYEGSDAGSTSTLTFVENAISDTLAEGVSKEQFVCAVPFFGRLWSGEGMGLTSVVYSMSEMQTFMEKNLEKTTWDETIGQYYVDTKSNGVEKRLWVEDEKSLDLKLSEIFDKDLAGIACWKLGKDNKAAWNSVLEYLRKAN